MSNEEKMHQRINTGETKLQKSLNADIKQAIAFVVEQYPGYKTSDFGHHVLRAVSFATFELMESLGAFELSIETGEHEFLASLKEVDNKPAPGEGVH